jgi:general secretion pathway protein A
MYECFFGFKEEPFHITPDPRFLCLTRQHREALSQVAHGIKEKKGVGVLTGEVGTGKTTIVRALLERLNRDYQVAYVFNPRLSVTDFLGYVFHDLGLEAKDSSEDDLVRRFHSFLVESHKKGKTTALIVDEAQDLEDGLIEVIGILATLQASSQRLLQLLLVGQPELTEILKRVDLRRLGIALRCHLSPLDLRETKGYIRTRLKIAGVRNPGCFADGSIEKIYEHSQGIPRVINNICDNSFLLGYARRRRIIDKALVDEVVKGLWLSKRDVLRIGARI